MNSEDKLNQQTWEILKDIEEQFLVTLKGKPVKYRIPNVVGGGTIPKQRREDILFKLEEQKAFKIQKGSNGARLTNQSRDAFYLIIKSPNFKKVVELYRPKAPTPNAEEELDYSDSTLRREYEKKWEIIKILKSHYVAKETPKIILIWAKAFIKGEVKTLADAASYFAVFQHAGCFKKYALSTNGNQYAFLDFNKVKLFETYRTVEEHYKRFAAEYQITHPPTPFDWTTVSQKNLVLAQKVIEIILDYFELRHINRLTQTGKIPLSKFQAEHIHLEEVSAVLQKIDGVKVTNGALLQLLRVHLKSTRYISSTGIQKPDGLPTEAELNTYVFLRISSFDEMRRIKGIIDVALKKTSDPQAPEEPSSSPKEIEVGELASLADGSIHYGNTLVKTRSQLKELCRLFMEKHRRLVTPDDIKDRIVDAKKRKTIKWSTISKYVSELHNSLKVHFGKDVIFNQSQEGWYFDPDRN